MPIWEQAAIKFGRGGGGGGNVRVNEDSLWIGKGRWAR